MSMVITNANMNNLNFEKMKDIMLTNSDYSKISWFITILNILKNYLKSKKNIIEFLKYIIKKRKTDFYLILFSIINLILMMHPNENKIFLKIVNIIKFILIIISFIKLNKIPFYFRQNFINNIIKKELYPALSIGLYFYIITSNGSNMNKNLNLISRVFKTYCFDN